jgi:hypothetical protein
MNGEENQIEGEENDQKTREEIEKKIQSISSQSQSNVFIAMLALFLFITSYFVGIYLYSRFCIDNFKQSFDDMHTIHERGICLTKLMFYAREDIQNGVEATLTGSST